MKTPQQSIPRIQSSCNKLRVWKSALYSLNISHKLHVCAHMKAAVANARRFEAKFKLILYNYCLSASGWI